MKHTLLTTTILCWTVLAACGGDDGLSAEERSTLCVNYSDRCETLCDRSSTSQTCFSQSLDCVDDCMARLGLIAGESCYNDDPQPIARACGRPCPPWEGSSRTSAVGGTSAPRRLQ